MFPVWFLQGLELLKAVALLQVLIRFAALIPIFVFVTLPEHGVRVLLAQGFMSVLGGVTALYWMKKNRLVDWYWPLYKDIFATLKNGATLFGSRISISFYTNLIPLVLGWMAGPVALAYFNVADKLRSAGQSLLGPLSQALYPRMSHLFNTDTKSAFRLFKKSVIITIVLAGSASVGLWLLCEVLVTLVAGENYEQSALVLQWLAPLPLIIGISNLLGVQIMLANRINKPFNAILAAAAALSLVLVWPLIYFFEDIGAAATLLIVEIAVTSTMVIYLSSKGYFANLSWKEK